MSDQGTPVKEEPQQPGASPNLAQQQLRSALNSAGYAELEEEDDEDGGDEEESEEVVVSSGDKRRMFSKELRMLLFGYGDDMNPYTETVDTLEDLVVEFINDMTQRAMEIGRTGRVQVEDIIFLVRKHPRMYARVKELLVMNEELKKARKAFDEIKYVQGSS